MIKGTGILTVFLTLTPALAADRKVLPAGIVFDDGGPFIVLVSEETLFFNDDLKPIFVSNADYAATQVYSLPRRISAPLKLGEASRWDMQRGMVQFKGAKGSLWIRCQDIVPRQLLCSKKPPFIDEQGYFHVSDNYRPSSAGAEGLMQVRPDLHKKLLEDLRSLGAAPDGQSRVPTCPGDPRCP